MVRVIRLMALVIALSLGGFQIANALAVGDTTNAAAKPKRPSVTAEVRIESLEKEADFAVTKGPQGAQAGLNVLFDRKGAYGNPELTVTPDLWIASYELGVYFNDQPGPVSGPTVKLIHKVCDRSNGLC
jgi:hypothetical protein